VDIKNSESFNNFINEIKNAEYDPNVSIMESLWSQYERVVIESIISSFGLGIFINDQDGGDVDTIKNVRDTKQFRNSKYQEKYDKYIKDRYDSSMFHMEDKYYEKTRDLMIEKQMEGKLKDVYTDQIIDKDDKFDLEHIISAKEIHDDMGRVLAGISPVRLANCKDNLDATDYSINRSKSDESMSDFIDRIAKSHDARISFIQKLRAKELLNDNEKVVLNKLEKLEIAYNNKEHLKEVDKTARQKYNDKLAKKYYKSKEFWTDTGTAALSLGAKMGIRQVFGFCFCEIWFSIKEELDKVGNNCEWNDLFNAIDLGIKNGINNVNSKYSVLLNKFKLGLESGITASLGMTLTNIFFTTSKNLVKNIRLSSTFVIQSGNIILFNPDDLDLGQRLREASIVIITGASVIIGSAVGESLRTSPIATIPEVGDIIIAFISALTSGIMSCTILCFLDRSKTIKQLLYFLDQIPTEVNNYKEIAEYMEKYYAMLEKYDLEKFKNDISSIHNITNNINKIDSDDELNKYLLSVYDELNIPKPWTGDIDSFMSNKENYLKFS
jgi:hypothetical protein